MNRIAMISLLVSAAFLFTGCGDGEETSPTQGAVAPAPTQGEVQADPHAGMEMNSSQRRPVDAGAQGRVLSVTQAGTYTYLEVDVGGKVIWLASSHTNVSEGEVVRWSDSALMRNFKSKALDRTFEEIHFVSTVLPASAPMYANSGRVLTVMTGGGYSYVEVNREVEGNVWLAGPLVQVAVGDTVSWSDGSMMRGFSSETLGRTFDEILFVGGIDVVAGR